MKVTPSTKFVQTFFDVPDEGYVCILFQTYFCESAPRVVEFPKVWRVDGKQYKVHECTYERLGDSADQKAPTIRIPKGVIFEDLNGDCPVVEY